MASNLYRRALTSVTGAIAFDMTVAKIRAVTGQTEADVLAEITRRATAAASRVNLTLQAIADSLLDDATAGRWTGAT